MSALDMDFGDEYDHGADGDHVQDVEDSAADAFELEMSEELERRARQAADKERSSAPTHYEDIYFDSDQEDDGEGGDSSKAGTSKKKEARRIKTDDDLFYDPDEDDEHQKYIDSIRRDYYDAAQPG